MYLLVYSRGEIRPRCFPMHYLVLHSCLIYKTYRLTFKLDSTGNSTSTSAWNRSRSAHYYVSRRVYCHLGSRFLLVSEPASPNRSSSTNIQFPYLFLHVNDGHAPVHIRDIHRAEELVHFEGLDPAIKRTITATTVRNTSICMYFKSAKRRNNYCGESTRLAFLDYHKSGPVSDVYGRVFSHSYRAACCSWLVAEEIWFSTLSNLCVLHTTTSYPQTQTQQAEHGHITQKVPAVASQSPEGSYTMIARRARKTYQAGLKKIYIYRKMTSNTLHEMEL